MWRLPRTLMKVAGKKTSQHKTRVAGVETSYPKALMRVAGVKTSYPKALMRVASKGGSELPTCLFK
ncbi:unnamed protein product [Prunus armeniaca]|uniref:Uncharacterized protein n=1 Tax=Prunus armeniaca TaxID=36596 RepID=A0A6J5TJF6_PRUAR|nr:unnamed protein product [Prunus armeniaca]